VNAASRAQARLCLQPTLVQRTVPWQCAAKRALPKGGSLSGLFSEPTLLNND
jgi:hypothetical protein